MTPLTHALVTVAELLDELGDTDRYYAVRTYTHGEVSVQVSAAGSQGLTVLAALADRFGVDIHRGVPWTDSYDRRTSREVSVTVVRDQVPVSFWIREDVAS